VKAVIWAHNGHLGDSSAAHRGEITVGKLIRDHWGMNRTANIGFTSYDGSVSAFDNWGYLCDFKRVNPGMQGSVEELFHNALQHIPNHDGKFLMIFRTTESDKDLAEQSVIEHLGTNNYLERAIGVIYSND
jgi:erythromycin esterase-like protein